MGNENLKLDDPEDDDRPVGRVLSRREILALLGSGSAVLFGGLSVLAADSVYLPIIANNPATATFAPTAPTSAATGTATATATSTPTPTATAVGSVTPTPLPTAVCAVRPELTEGPYFVDELLNRADIRSDPTSGTVKSGAQLQLTLRIYSVGNNACTALSGAFVDIWHCDAVGLYSDVSQNGTVGQKFLRGYQVADANGLVTFTTIYPGWYTGRAVHIHFKIRQALTSNPSYEFTSQFFFTEALNDEVHAQTPYASKGRRDTLNSNDNIYSQGGSQLVLPVIKSGSVYAATFDVGFVM